MGLLTVAKPVTMATPPTATAVAEIAQRSRVAVATDIAARGLDIDDLPQVVNFELPHVAEDYVHRIGRRSDWSLPSASLLGWWSSSKLTTGSGMSKTVPLAR